jgi:sugar (pentulose or hexulose) kinase
VLRALSARLPDQERSQVRALTVVSTSGTLVLSDGAGQPVHPAIMWDDTRALGEARTSEEAAVSLIRSTGHGLNPTSPIAKLLWIEEHRRELLASTEMVATAGDWLAWRMGAPRPTTDPTRSLKLGFSAWDGRWDPEIDAMWFRGRLPEVRPAAEVIGQLDPELARACGLPDEVSLVNGVTDANAAFLAAGAVDPGDWVSTIGTGMSVKAATGARVFDPRGQVYSQPWLLGSVVASGTSRCGAGGLDPPLGADDTQLMREAATARPGGMLVFPLAQVGDVFPFRATRAEGYVIGDGPPALRLRAGLEGLAAMEGFAIDRLLDLGVEPPVRHVATGGTARSALFMRIRASMLRAPIEAMAEPGSCVGAAMLAMAGTGVGVAEAVAAVGRPGRIVAPDPGLIDLYQDVRRRHLAELDRRGYLEARPVVAPPSGAGEG